MTEMIISENFKKENIFYLAPFICYSRNFIENSSLFEKLKTLMSENKGVVSLSSSKCVASLLNKAPQQKLSSFVDQLIPSLFNNVEKNNSIDSLISLEWVKKKKKKKKFEIKKCKKNKKKKKKRF